MTSCWAGADHRRAPQEIGPDERISKHDPDINSFAGLRALVNWTSLSV